MTNPLIATSSDLKPTDPGYRDASTGFGFADDYKSLAQTIRGGSWIDYKIAELGTALDLASVAIDPFSTLLSMGIEWAIEQVQPLRDALDWLAGDPTAVETHAQTWDRMAAELYGIGDELQRLIDTDLQGWQGAAANAYREMLDVNVDVAGMLGGTAEGMSAATRGAGMLVAMVRDFVRGFVADCIAKVVVWLAEEVLTLGAATPLVASQLAVAVARWTGKIFGWLMALVTSIEALRALLDF